MNKNVEPKQAFANLVASIRGPAKPQRAAPVPVPPDKVFLTGYQERALLQIARGGWAMTSDLDSLRAIDNMEMMLLITPDPSEWYVCTPAGRSVCTRYLRLRRRERQERRAYSRRSLFSIG